MELENLKKQLAMMSQLNEDSLQAAEEGEGAEGGEPSSDQGATGDQRWALPAVSDHQPEY